MKRMVVLIVFTLLLLPACSSGASNYLNRDVDTPQMLSETVEENAETDNNRALLDSEMVYRPGDVRYVEDYTDESGHVRLEPGMKYSDFRLKKCPIEQLSTAMIAFQHADAIECIDGKYYIVDSTSNHIAIFDLKNESVAIWGQFGRGAGEFSLPCDIFYCQSSNQIYILDSGNHRVQVFDAERGYLKEIDLAPLEISKPQYYQSLAIDRDGNVYIAVNNNVQSRMRLARIDQDGQVYYYPGFFIGELFSYAGDIYCYDTLEVFVYRDEKRLMDSSATNGKSGLYRIAGDERLEIAQFPQCYSPSCVAIVGDLVYAMGASDNRLDLFSLSKNDLIYQHSLTEQFNASAEQCDSPFCYDFVIVDDMLYLVINAPRRGLLYRMILQE